MKTRQPRRISPVIKVLTQAEMDAEVELHLQVLGWCVTRRRKALGLSQEELAALAHVSRGEIQHNEHGRHGMTESTKKRICLGLGISVVELDAEVQRVTMEWKADGRGLKK
jgi:ribosome-binding protein aMBF1 (putative translation factor)